MPSNDSNFATNSCTSRARDVTPSAKPALRAALIHASNGCVSSATGLCYATVHVAWVAGCVVHRVVMWESLCILDDMAGAPWYFLFFFLFSITDWDQDNEMDNGVLKTDGDQQESGVGISGAGDLGV